MTCSCPADWLHKAVGDGFLSLVYLETRGFQIWTVALRIKRNCVGPCVCPCTPAMRPHTGQREWPGWKRWPCLRAPGRQPSVSLVPSLLTVWHRETRSDGGPLSTCCVSRREKALAKVSSGLCSPSSVFTSLT